MNAENSFPKDRGPGIAAWDEGANNTAILS